MSNYHGELTQSYYNAGQASTTLKNNIASTSHVGYHARDAHHNQHSKVIIPVIIIMLAFIDIVPIIKLSIHIIL